MERLDPYAGRILDGCILGCIPARITGRPVLTRSAGAAGWGGRKKGGRRKEEGDRSRCSAGSGPAQIVERGRDGAHVLLDKSLRLAQQVQHLLQAGEGMIHFPIRGGQRRAILRRGREAPGRGEGGGLRPIAGGQNVVVESVGALGRGHAEFPAQGIDADGVLVKRF